MDPILYQRVVDLKNYNYEKVFASNFPSIKRLRNLFRQLNQNIANRDFCINKLIESEFAFVGGLSLLFMDPVVELALNRVSTYIF